eukprot:g1656.t1
MLEFRAGKMKLEERQLVPDSRKGKVKITQDGDGLIHFQWITDAGYAEDDIFLFPDQATFSKIGPQHERVYALKLKDKSKTLFFWMQESNGDRDVSVCQRVNQLLNNQNLQQLPQQSALGAPSASALAQMLSGMAQQHQQQQQGPSLQQQAKLAAALLSSACGTALGTIPKKAKGPNLAQVLKPEVLIKYIEQPGMLLALAEFLPESQRSQSDLVNQCLSPQLSQQLSLFSAALETGRFDPAALGLSVEGYSAIDFLNAIQKLVDEEQSKTGQSSSKE